ncbi:1-phosphofructokinase [Natribacillus halophilus]|uniref:Tagatose-6-phosphate kinase n=1 Tax=Natribacillus halophilus TaxID=549003 RepID=A0A1G8SB84_9BACI|nr:1-phosphofructokinase [Natribacillus halophilus]SDJ26488.1 fructose-1-phosphate kinase [Natribacillus halophilus]
MIYTLTLNPAVDYIVRVSDFELGRINRSETDVKYPGGKGINVSRVLNRLGQDNTALGFVGGFTGRFIEDSLAAENIRTDFVSVAGDTRLNIKLKTLEETEINGQSTHISAANMGALKEKLALLKKGDTLILAGSLPETVSPGTYYDIIHTWVPKDIRCFLDTNGDALFEALRARPFFIKPNHHELAELYNVPIASPEQAAFYGKKLQTEYSVPHVLVSMASQGVLYIHEEEIVHIQPPRGTLVNSVGAGDSTVAGFLAKYEKTNDPKEAAIYAVAAGSASAFSEGFCTKAEVDRYSNNMQCERINI